MIVYFAGWVVIALLFGILWVLEDIKAELRKMNNKENKQ